MRLPCLRLLVLLAAAAPWLRAEETPAEAPTPESIQALVRQLGARYLDERQKAQEALARVGTAAEPALRKALDDEDVRVRRGACELLGRLKSAAAVPRLIDLLQDPDTYVQEASQEALVRIGPAALDPVMKAHAAGRVSNEILAAFQRTLQRQVEALLNACITDPTLTTRLDAVELPGWGFYDGQFDEIVALGKPAAPILLRLFTARLEEYTFAHPFEREAQESQVRFVWRGRVASMLDIRKSIVQRLAGSALGEFRDPALLPPLKKFIESLGDVDPFAETPEAETRTEAYEIAAHSLRKLGDPSFFEALKGRYARAAGLVPPAASPALAERGRKREDQFTALQGLAMLQIRADQLEEAVRTFQTTLALAEKDQRELEAEAEKNKTDPAPPVNPSARTARTASSPHLSGTYYNLACAYAQMGKKAEALDSLQKAVQYNYKNVSWMKRDGDLKSLHNEPAFKTLVGEIERRQRQLEGMDPLDLEEH
jgi:HEAT repeat protein